MKIPHTLDKVAIVLGEENLLVPLLFVAFLCWCFEYHNGLPSKNPAQILIAKLFKMHTNALAKCKNYVLYYKRCAGYASIGGALCANKHIS
jgi:hypothetical protein